MRRMIPVLMLVSLAMGARAQDDAPVFRSDVRLVRVDAQVVDASNRAITVLQERDFRLIENGRKRQIKNFLAEDMPVDVLLLLDVSGSMRPNIELVERASSDALRVLAAGDRVAIMTFTRGTRVRLPFLENKQEVQRALSDLIESERFNGGTDIFRGMVDAIEYVGKNARQDARRAIVIVTDDQTELHRDDDAVVAALAEADTVLSALLAPNAMRGLGGNPGAVVWPRLPGLGSIIIGGGGRGRYPGGGTSGTRSGGTPEIAQASGGDSMNVGSAYAFRETLERIRQRYALHFNLPPTARASEIRRVTVELTESARRRYPDAQLRYRGAYRTPAGLPPPSPGAQDEEDVISQSVEQQEDSKPAAEKAAERAPEGGRRQGRVIVDETERVRGPLPAVREKPAAAQKTSAAETLAPAWRTATPADVAEAERAGKEAGKAQSRKQ